MGVLSAREACIGPYKRDGTIVVLLDHTANYVYMQVCNFTTIKGTVLFANCMHVLKLCKSQCSKMHASEGLN
jgi:hypothetical protein